MLKSIVAVFILCFCQGLHAQTLSLVDKDYVNDLHRQIALTESDSERDSLLQTIVEYYIWIQPDSALFYAQQKVMLAKNAKALGREALSTGYYGYILGLQGNYPRAIEYLLSGLRLSESQGEKEQLDFFYDALSNTYLDLNDFKHALFYANKFRDISLQNKDTLFYGWLLTKGIVFERFNQLDSALFYLQRIYDFEIRETGEVTRARTLLTLGNVYLKKEFFPQALHHFQSAVSVSKNTGHHINLAEAYTGLSKLYATTGAIDSGIYYANQAYILCRSTAFATGELTASSLLSALYKKRNIKDSTIKYLELTNGLKDSLFNQEKEREIQNLSFSEQMRQQDLIASEQKYRNQLRQYGLMAGVLLLLAVAALLYRNNRNKQKAYTVLQKQKEETEQQKNRAEHTLEELKATQAQLIQREKMASLGELTAGVAHEIQNPLNFVNNFSEVSIELTEELKEELADLEINESRRENIDAVISDIIQNQQKINQHGKRADGIVKAMMQHSGKSRGKKEPVNINSLVDEYLQLSYHSFRSKDQSFKTLIQTNFDAGAEKIVVVPQDIARVLLTVFNNAFYSLREKAKLLNGTFEPSLLVTTLCQQGHITISIRDNGMGIPEKIISKIYQPFFTTKPTGEGTGLGLSLSYDIISEGHGGQINVQSTEGEYAEFSIMLPGALKT